MSYKTQVLDLIKFQNEMVHLFFSNRRQTEAKQFKTTTHVSSIYDTVVLISM